MLRAVLVLDVRHLDGCARPTPRHRSCRICLPTSVRRMASIRTRTSLIPRILVIDGDSDTCRFIAEVLGAPEREFELATEYARALQLAPSEPFDLVICDINLNSSLSGLD